ncbi:MAG: sigma-70 family RNA polymerase sigma factor [Planctomycetes bacterium]|nr:sigma-70 family RNA polymerase sigma factor [Planctomycetota bacterium]
MGGSQSGFPQTSAWAVLRSGEGWEERYRQHLERLARAYWKPIYCMIRRGWSRSDADAKDLTQSFWIHIQEHDLLRRFDPNRGNFRTWLKRCLKSFLGTAARDAARLKRGGGRSPVSLDGGLGEGVAADVPAPEGVFDSTWAAEVLARSEKDAETRLRSEGKAVYFEVLRLYTTEDKGTRPTYRAVAERLGLRESDVGNYLRIARQTLRTCVLDAIREYVLDSDLDSELDVILGLET